MELNELKESLNEIGKEFSDLMDAIKTQHSDSEARQKRIDEMKETMRNETRPVVVEEMKEQIKQLEEEKKAIDEMTAAAVARTKAMVEQVRSASQEKINEEIVRTASSEGVLLRAKTKAPANPDKDKRAEMQPRIDAMKERARERATAEAKREVEEAAKKQAREDAEAIAKANAPTAVLNKLMAQYIKEARSEVTGDTMLRLEQEARKTVLENRAKLELTNEGKNVDDASTKAKMEEIQQRIDDLEQQRRTGITLDDLKTDPANADTIALIEAIDSKTKARLEKEIQDAATKKYDDMPKDEKDRLIAEETTKQVKSETDRLLAERRDTIEADTLAAITAKVSAAIQAIDDRANGMLDGTRLTDVRAKKADLFALQSEVLQQLKDETEFLDTAYPDVKPDVVIFKKEDTATDRYNILKTYKQKFERAIADAEAKLATETNPTERAKLQKSIAEGKAELKRCEEQMAALEAELGAGSKENPDGTGKGETGDEGKGGQGDDGKGGQGGDGKGGQEPPKALTKINGAKTYKSLGAIDRYKAKLEMYHMTNGEYPSLGRKLFLFLRSPKYANMIQEHLSDPTYANEIETLKDIIPSEKIVIEEVKPEPAKKDPTKQAPAKKDPAKPEPAKQEPQALDPEIEKLAKTYRKDPTFIDTVDPKYKQAVIDAATRQVEDEKVAEQYIREGRLDEDKLTPSQKAALAERRNQMEEANRKAKELIELIQKHPELKKAFAEQGIVDVLSAPESEKGEGSR